MPTGVYIRTKEHNTKISESLVGVNKKQTLCKGQEHHRWKGGLPTCVSCPKKLSTYKKGGLCKKCFAASMSGENSVHWKGGITPENKKIRNSTEYREWRKDVFERDDYTCQICSVRGVELNADHIKPFSRFPKLRLELSNGRTLCVPCHSQTDTYKGRINKK